MKSLKLGDKGEEVKVLQQMLNLQGANLKIDGDFGKGTKAAVIQFQYTHTDRQGVPLSPDGKVGSKTWGALTAVEANDKNPPPDVKRDPVTLRRIKTIHPQLRTELLEIYNEILERGVGVRFTSVLRSFKEQDAIYAQGRWGNPGSIVSHARGGQSYHNYGLAVDFCLLKTNGQVSWNRSDDLDRDGQSDWMEIASAFKMYGWEWGGDWNSFKDYPHVQKTFGYKTPRLLQLKAENRTDDEGYVIL
ncbi:putative peptidoglycan-binding domain-containing protein [Owenweeksia hongkongensis DSM 17368]|uniref:Putative peptidoglycan-binding domain-containing protein n=1 Tax=Owenweeksia hongkongensis (strain DSM 17368 / CIP 108786 / JCM 12287 / NRRL B-23963 / UST20020801) TaxID=926562 RepID=G8R1V5_OWEHD|nr:M15 family metallopeptidase [Owenweeksia hongkongensis]AEV33905.1 putative peptidoglycan-binding domain-containing protein [Owenweeksia hongkongensis DSM 17368]